MEIISKESLKDFYYNEFNELLDVDQRKASLLEYMLINGYKETLLRVNEGEFDDACANNEISFSEFCSLI